MNGNKLKPKSLNSNPFFMSTRPNWTRFWILRANQIHLNPKIEPKIGLNPKKWVKFSSTNLPDLAPTYLLLPLGKWGSKWGDFYWAMWCV